MAVLPDDFREVVSERASAGTGAAAKGSLAEYLAEVLNLPIGLLRIAGLTQKKNIVNRVHYESGWENAAVMVCMWESGGSCDFDLPYVRSKIDEYVREYPQLHEVAPRLRLVIYVRDAQICAVDKIYFADKDISGVERSPQDGADATKSRVLGQGGDDAGDAHAD